MRKLVAIGVKLTLSAGLIWFAFSKLDAESAFTLVARLPPLSALGALVLLMTSFAVTALRMRILLATIGPRLSFFPAFDAVLIGAFFSQTLISFVGGDAMRIWRLMRSNVSLSDAARSVLYDRVFGFLGLILLIAIGLPLLLNVVADSRVHMAILFLIGASIAGCALLLSLHLLPAVIRKRRIFAFGARVAEMGHDLLNSPKRLIILLALSLLLQSLNVLAIYWVAVGLSVRVDLVMCLALIPPVMFLSMMPISFAGWGVRESAMVAALSAVGVPASQSLAMSISYGLGLVIASLPGGLLWLLARRPKSVVEDTSAHG